MWEKDCVASEKVCRNELFSEIGESTGAHSSAKLAGLSWKKYVSCIRSLMLPAVTTKRILGSKNAQYFDSDINERQILLIGVLLSHVNSGLILFPDLLQTWVRLWSRFPKCRCFTLPVFPSCQGGSSGIWGACSMGFGLVVCSWCLGFHYTAESEGKEKGNSFAPPESSSVRLVSMVVTTSWANEGTETFLEVIIKPNRKCCIAAHLVSCQESPYCQMSCTSIRNSAEQEECSLDCWAGSHDLLGQPLLLGFT